MRRLSDWITLHPEAFVLTLLAVIGAVWLVVLVAELLS